jgi:hypothetical protein
MRKTVIDSERFVSVISVGAEHIFVVIEKPMPKHNIVVKYQHIICASIVEAVIPHERTPSKKWRHDKIRSGTQGTKSHDLFAIVLIKIFLVLPVYKDHLVDVWLLCA